MTEQLRGRLEETLNSRHKKVESLYREHVTVVLEAAEAYFVKYPMRLNVTLKIPYPNIIFLAYLRKIACSDKWNFYVEEKGKLELKLSKRVTIYRRECDRYEKERIEESYRRILGEEVE